MLYLFYSQRRVRKSTRTDSAIKLLIEVKQDYHKINTDAKLNDLDDNSKSIESMEVHNNSQEYMMQR